ncbi:MAG: hypothetical protein PWR20_1610 [Bacteroidales bacterium]|jgi:hypothetical protein|nr:hypothetical protein [Bacteroidales bacterium]MDN5330735.1 hypothetical protein [Bacteroidales bacterium]NLH53822.1 hypothetical protein [Bacteroidales bacterium]NPV36599.1 hypothetical protein [Bacteroidales bacterium]
MKRISLLFIVMCLYIFVSATPTNVTIKIYGKGGTQTTYQNGVATVKVCPEVDPAVCATITLQIDLLKDNSVPGVIEVIGLPCTVKLSDGTEIYGKLVGISNLAWSSDEGFSGNTAIIEP